MGVGSGLYMYDVVVKRSRSLSHLLMSSCWGCDELQCYAILAWQCLLTSGWNVFGVKVKRTETFCSFIPRGMLVCDRV